jgi:hypothetical protein
MIQEKSDTHNIERGQTLLLTIAVILLVSGWSKVSYAQDYLDSQSPQERAATETAEQLAIALSSLRHADGTPEIFGVAASQDKQGNWAVTVILDDYPTLPEVAHAIPPSMNGFKVYTENRRKVRSGWERHDKLMR